MLFAALELLRKHRVVLPCKENRKLAFKKIMVLPGISGCTGFKK